MLTKAEESYKNLIIEYLKLDEGMNTPMLANIERYGLSRGFQDVWLYHADYSEPKAVVMRHFNHLYLYFLCEDADYEEIASFSSFFCADTVWSGLRHLEAMKPFMQNYMLEPSKHMILPAGDSLIPFDDVENAVAEDSRELAGMIFDEKDFSRFYSGIPEIELGIRRRVEMGQCRYMIIRQGGCIVAQAYSAMETEHYVTVGGVITRSDCRGRGLAGRVVSALCHEILMTGKKPNLFYKIPEAGSVYRRIGFAEAGDYGTLCMV